MKKSKKIILALFMLVLSMQFSGINQATARLIIPPPPPTEPLAFFTTPSDFSCDSGDSISMTWKAFSGYTSGRSSNLYRSFDNSNWELIASKGPWGDALPIIYSTTAPFVSYDLIHDVYYKIKVTDSSGSIYDTVKVTVNDESAPTPLHFTETPVNIDCDSGVSVDLIWKGVSDYYLFRTAVLYKEILSVPVPVVGSLIYNWDNNEEIIYTITAPTLGYDEIQSTEYEIHLHDSSGTIIGPVTVTTHGLPLPDDDHDLMNDNWEDANGLDSNINDSNGDPDNDGLVNLDEYYQDTDPQDSDTDNDLFLDGAEIHIMNTDPNKFDYPDYNYGNFEYHDSIGSAPYNWAIVDDEIVVAQHPEINTEKVLGLSISEGSIAPCAYIPISSGVLEHDVYYSFEGAIYGSPVQDFNGRICLFGGGNIDNEINFIFDFFQGEIYLNDGLLDQPEDGIPMDSFNYGEFYLIEVLIHFVDDMNYNYKIWINNVLVYSPFENIWLEEIIPEFTQTYVEVSGPLCDAVFYLDNIIISEARIDPYLEDAIADEIYPKDYLLGGYPVISFDPHDLSELDYVADLTTTIGAGQSYSDPFGIFDVSFYRGVKQEDYEIYNTVVMDFEIEMPLDSGPDLFVGGKYERFFQDGVYVKSETRFHIGLRYQVEEEITTLLTVGAEVGIKTDHLPVMFKLYIQFYIEIEIGSLKAKSSVEFGLAFTTVPAIEYYEEASLLFLSG